MLAVLASIRMTNGQAGLDARVREWLHRLMGSMRGGRTDADLRDELQAHLDLAAEDAANRGQPAPAAARLARVRAGGDVQAIEGLRDQRGVPWIDDLARDLRYAARTLRRSPAFTLVAILTLALGMGANAAVYQLVDAVRLRPLPVKNPRQLVIVGLADTSRRGGRQATSYPAVTNAVWEHFRDHQQALSGVTAWFASSLQLDEEIAAGSARGLFVSGDFFQVLGVPPHLGRVFAASDDRQDCGAAGAVLSYGFWQRQFGAQPTAIGRPVTLNGQTVEVIGVTPPEFFGVEVGRRFDVALPLCSHAVLGDERDWLGNKAMWWLTVIGRMRPGQSLEHVNAALQAGSRDTFESTLPPEYRADDAQNYRSLRLLAASGATGVSALRNRYGDPLVILLITTGLVLLIACTNLANLILARASAREREFSVRLAIGASWSRLVRQLMVENALLALGGALAALALAGMLSRLLVGFLDPRLSLDLHLDAKLFGFMLATAILTCLAFGLIPAWRASRVAAADAMKSAARTVSGSREGVWTRRALVIAQVALSLVLAFGALLFAATLRNLRAVDMGFHSADLVVARVNFSRLSLPASSRGAFKRDLLERVRGIPGVAAAEVRHVPMGGTATRVQIWRDGFDPATRKEVLVNRISEDYFRVVGISPIAGRHFTEREAATSARVAVVNQPLLALLDLGQSPIGETLRIGDESNSEVFEIVGLVPDTIYASPRETPRPIVFLPVDPSGDPRPFTDLMIRSALTPGQLRLVLRQTLASMSALLGLDIQVYDDTIRSRIAPERLMGVLSVFFGGLSLLIAAIGLHGVMSYAVTQRTHEIGVRVALGASRSHIAGLVLREAAVLAGLGLALGSALALAGADTLRSLVFGVDPRDVRPIALACLLLAAVALLASVIPAWRAARVEPLTTLRSH